MARLTDKKVAEDLKRNADGLKAVGLDIPMSDRRYIKLAEYEDKEERVFSVHENDENYID